jgi:RNAse (barnase) inhibitor barstar
MGWADTDNYFLRCGSNVYSRTIASDMAYFNNSADDWQRIDWQVLRDGGIALYWRSEYLAEDARWLHEHDYELYEMDCAKWSSRDDMFADFDRAFRLPEWWGRNFDALDECMADLPLDEKLGAALVLRHFDSYASQFGAAPLARRETEAVVILDILARASRFHLLNGRRFVVLVQSDDSNLQIEQLGGMTPQWNRREWLTASREPNSR